MSGLLNGPGDGGDPPDNPVQQEQGGNLASVSSPSRSVTTSPSNNSNSSYTNMAAKTVANIRRLQENIAVTQTWTNTPQLGAASARGDSQNLASSSPAASQNLASSSPAASHQGTAGGEGAASLLAGEAQQVELEDTNCCLSPVQQPMEDLDPITQHMSSLTVSMPAPLPESPPPSPRPNLSQTSSLNALATLDPNWQSTKNSLRERNAAMFNNTLMADIYFLVGQADSARRFPAHKYILATGSTVFYAMLYGGLADDKAEEISVPDVDPDAFLALLKYLYCDDIYLEPDNVLATLYAAKKYIVPHLAQQCVKYLETSLTARNACLLLSQSRLFEEPELMSRCWDVIDAQAEIALRSEGFTDIDFHTLETILARETLNCKEIVVFDAALSWASAECCRRGEVPTPDLQRQVLGNAMNLIRFPAMAVEDFADFVAQSGMLSLQETTDIFLHFTAKHKPVLDYPSVARVGMSPQVCHRFQSSAYRSNQWRYRGRCDSIQFYVDRRVFIVGFGLYGSSNGSADYNVRIELKHGGRTMATNNQKFFSDGSSNTFHVFFDHPVQIEADKSYTASAVLDGVELSYFGQEGMSEVVVGKVAFQFQCSSESTNGTGVQGGQIPEIIFYGPSPD